MSNERERPTEGVKEKLAKLSAEAAKYLMEHGNEEQQQRAAKFVLEAQR